MNDDFVDKLRHLLSTSAKNFLTDWEKNFLEELISRYEQKPDYLLSQGQLKVLNSIKEKLVNKKLTPRKTVSLNCSDCSSSGWRLWDDERYPQEQPFATRCDCMSGNIALLGFLRSRNDPTALKQADAYERRTQDMIDNSLHYRRAEYKYQQGEKKEFTTHRGNTIQ